MAAPHRGNTGFSTYFITAATFQKHSLFQSDRMANLFLEVLLHYRSQKKYLTRVFASITISSGQGRAKPELRHTRVGHTHNSFIWNTLQV